jgi:hypothetical protein
VLQQMPIVRRRDNKVFEARDKIFVSYAHADEAVAKRIGECLEGKHYDMSFDQKR